MGKEVIMLIVFGAVLVGMGIVFLITKKNSNNQKNSNEDISKGAAEKTAQPTQSIKRNSKPVEQHDINEFVKFDKIANDMIYQNNGERYTMVIQCKGVNYHLMSEIEQMAIEEGFIMFLNTLKYPIQLYVQTKSIDLTSNVRGYKEKVKEFADKQNEVTARYHEVEDDVDSTQEEIDYMKKEKLKYTNIAEYAYDITRYVEKMALNKHMLQRNFYIIFSYNKSELATTEKFTPEEYEDLCYRELYTRAQAILGSLLTCSVTGRVLTSNELAQLVYTSLNKDDANLMPIKEALDSGLFRLYTTSEDVFRKRRELVEEEFEAEGRKRIEEAVKQAMAKGLLVTQLESEESVQKEIDRRALRMIDKSTVDENTKQVLKNTIKENRKERLEKIKEAMKETVTPYRDGTLERIDENVEESSDDELLFTNNETEDFVIGTENTQSQVENVDQETIVVENNGNSSDLVIETVSTPNKVENADQEQNDDIEFENNNDIDFVIDTQKTDLVNNATTADEIVIDDELIIDTKEGEDTDEK